MPDQPLIPMSEGIKIHYKAVVDNIIFLKRQQWTITNHAIVLYAAITALATGTNDAERVGLTALGLVGCIFSLLCTAHTQLSMSRYYQNLFEIHAKYFTGEERGEFEMLRSKPGFNHNGMFIWGLMAANFVGLIVASYFIWVKHGLPHLSS
jgi:hypothetical protein